MKILTLFFLILFLYSSKTLSSELEDCTAYSKFSPKFYKCKTSNFVKDTKDYQSKEWSDEKEKINKTKEKINKTKDKILN
tara:strand:+ start:80 stop:319 length:240 start_codon:yes stop_codon:yes gene_type:complete